MPDEEMGCGCGCQDCECKEINVCDTTERVHADLRDKLMVFADYVCTIALTPCSQLGKVMSKVVYYLWCMLKDIVNMIINNRKRTETLMENDEYFCDRMSAVSEWTINLSNTQARNHQKITKFIDDMTSLGSKTKENGFLSEVAPQSLTLLNEPNAKLTTYGNHISDSGLESAYKEPNTGWIDPSTIPYRSTKQTTTTTGKWQYFTVKVGDVVEATYTDLENSRFGDKKIASVKFRYELVELEGPNDYLVLSTISDPATTAYSFSWKDNGETSKYKYNVNVMFFDENGNVLNPSLDNPALLSFASLNSKNGDGEYVSDFSGKLIPITGSTITEEGGKVTNFSSVDQLDKAIQNGAPADTTDWEIFENGKYSYIGAIAGLATSPISFSFGHTSAQAQWFSFNTKVKAPVVEKPVLEPLPTLPYECNIREFEC